MARGWWRPAQVARAKAAGWPPSLMPGDSAPGVRQAPTVHRIVGVRANSPRAGLLPALLLYFATTATRRPWLPAARACDRRVPPQCQIGTAGRCAERSEGGGGGRRPAPGDMSAAQRPAVPIPRQLVEVVGSSIRVGLQQRQAQSRARFMRLIANPYQSLTQSLKMRLALPSQRAARSAFGRASSRDTATSASCTRCGQSVPSITWLVPTTSSRYFSGARS